MPEEPVDVTHHDYAARVLYGCQGPFPCYAANPGDEHAPLPYQWKTTRAVCLHVWDPQYMVHVRKNPASDSVYPDGPDYECTEKATLPVNPHDVRDSPDDGVPYSLGAEVLCCYWDPVPFCASYPADRRANLPDAQAVVHDVNMQPWIPELSLLGLESFDSRSPDAPPRLGDAEQRYKENQICYEERRIVQTPPDDPAHSDDT